MSSAAEKSNLARIRDNQRRSRARRKEYLQELEARLRQCELQGIEASSEIQLAARRVADENKKLRRLLGQHGVADDSVEAFLQSTASPDTMLGTGSFGSLGGMDSGSGAVQALEHLLNTRKPFCADGNTGAPGPMTTVATGSRDSSAGSMSTVQSVWESPFNNSMRPRNEHINTGGSAKPTQHQFMTPASSVSRAGSVLSTGHAGSISVQQQHHHHHHHHQQQQQQQRRIPSVAPSMSSSTSTSITTSQQKQVLFDFDAEASMLPSFNAHQHQHQHPQSHSNIATATQLAQVRSQPHPLRPVSRPSQYMPPVSTANGTVGGTNSCVFAADMITTMAGGDSHEVRAELGCMPSGMECEVNNQLVFNVMDRYTEQRIGL